MDMMEQVNRWRTAYGPRPPEKPFGIVMEESLLMTAGLPFASLFANDFLVWLENKGTMPEVIEFVRDIHREMVWAYDNWAKAQHQGDATRLMIDLMNTARGGGSPPGARPDQDGSAQSATFYSPIQKFLRDYADANGLLPKGKDSNSWMALLKEPEGPINPPGHVEVM